ncbi:hypothetical protein TWF281_005106 [Arthrobotrys megalospora]
MAAYYFALLALALPVRGEDGWDDFADNFATDLAPIITLFGEQVTKQFLSESTSILDNIIFAVAPLGILTAVVSVIRVCGSSSLRAFIGRAQEAHGISEAELCSSTSRDVCELWSNGGISRIFGRPRILEFIYSGSNDFFYPKFLPKNSPGGSIMYPPCGIHKTKAVLCPNEFPDDGGPTKPVYWKEIKSGYISAPSSASGTGESAEESFAPHPNLSLNVGIRASPRWVQWVVVVFGVSLQSSFFGYVAWAAYYATDLWEDGKPPQRWAFPFAAIGTGLLVTGMCLCAMLIERRTQERIFEEDKSRLPVPGEKNPVQKPRTMMFWLQPGDQSVGDQVFNAFAYWELKDRYVTSWRIDASAPSTSILAIWPAVIFTTVGFIFQFVGLRALHGSVPLYQLTATLIMAVIRAALRSKRIDEGKNRLKNRRDVEGNELDWIALQIDSAAQENSRSGPPLDPNDTNRFWCIVDLPPTSAGQNTASPPPPPTQVTPKSGAEVDILPSGTPTWRNIIGFAPKPNNGDEYACPRRAIEWIESHEKDETDNQRPNKAARIMHYRTRLARLTDPLVLGDREWETPIRPMAEKLKTSIEAAAAHIFSGEMKLSSNWKDARALVWSSTCQLNAPGDLNGERFPIHFLLYRRDSRWIISSHHLEAVLGLWRWSLKLHDDSRKFYTKKALLVTEASKKEEMKSTLRLWISQTLWIDEDDYSCPFQTSEPQSLLSIPASTFPPAGSKDRVILSAPTIETPLTLLAQDIFTMFINRIMDIIEPLEDIEPRTRRPQEGTLDLSISRDKPFLGLTQSSIEALVDSFSGLGTREDALISIIPSLLQKNKLPFPEEIARRLLRTAQIQRRSGSFDKCEDILKGLLQVRISNVETLVIRNLGELCRYSIRSRKESDRDLGRRIRTDLASMSNLSDDAKKMQQHYITAIREIEYPKNLDIEDNDNWDKLMKELDHEETRPFGLFLTAKYDLTNVFPVKYKRVVMWAIEKNCLELVEDLWDVTKPHIGYIWGSGDYGLDGACPTPLFWAVETGCDVETFQSVIDWPGAKLEWHHNNWGTVLVVAANKGLKTHVQALLEAGSDVNAQGGRYGNALQAAAVNGHYEIAELLLDKGADVNIQIPSGYYANALQAAIGAGHDTIVELLLRRGADVNGQSGMAGTALQIAAARGLNETVKLLLKNGADINAQDGDNNNALQAAAAKGQNETIELLLKKGADIDSRGREEETALQIALAGGFKDTVELLLKQGADINAQGGTYGTALQTAAAKCSPEMVEFLLSKGANINIQNGHCGSALQAAVEGGRTQIAELLLNKGADINIRDKFYGSPLQTAAINGFPDITKLLLDRGADINSGGGLHYENALHGAVSSGYEDITEILVSYGAEITDKIRQTAAVKGNKGIIEVLSQKPCDVCKAEGFESCLPILESCKLASYDPNDVDSNHIDW